MRDAVSGIIKRVLEGRSPSQVIKEETGIKNKIIIENVTLKKVQKVLV